MFGRILPRFSLQQVDRGWAALRKTVKTIRDSDNTVKVGVIGSLVKHEGDTGRALNNVQLAYVHEFGTRRVPARSFVRSTFEKKKAEMILLLARLVPGLYDGRSTVDQVLNLVGAKLAAEMKNTIRAGIPPPLAQSTLARRINAGGAVPLIDTGQLLNSISWEIEHK